MAVCMHYGLRSHLLGTMPPAIAADATKAQEWETRDERVLGDLTLSISTPLRALVRGVGTAKAAWDKILAVYETKLASNILHLRKEYYQCRMEDVTAKDAMQTHINRMRNLIDRLACVGTVITAEDAGVQLYLSLPDPYSNISAALSIKPISELTFDMVASVLLQEERRLQGLASATPSATAKAESALAAGLSPAGNSKPPVTVPRPRCSYCKKSGHTEGVCYKKHGYPVGHPLHVPDQDPRATFACTVFIVHDERRTVTTTATPPVSDTVAVASTVPPSPTSAPLALSTQPATSEWLVDSGASQHICASADWYATYQPVSDKSVIVANGQRIPAVGRGDIHVDIQINGRSESGTFRDVLYVPGMAYNLLSVTRMTEAGLNVAFRGKDCIIRSKDGRVIGRATRKVGTTSMYALHIRPHAGVAQVTVANFAVEETVTDTETKVDYVAADGLLPNHPAIALRIGSADTGATVEDSSVSLSTPVSGQSALPCSNHYAVLGDADSKSDDGRTLPRHTAWELAHLRMGHLHSKALGQLPAMATDAEWIHAGAQGPILPCEGCLIGKSHRAPMPAVATHRATQRLELVHSDVAGPFSTMSVGGCWYFVSFIDDCTNLVAVFPIARKSDVLDRFLTFRAWAETQTGARIRTLRTDGGGEYLSHEFDQRLRATGVARQRTPPYTPQHNGVAERANRTLMNAVRAVLISARMPDRFWALALQAAVYLRNRSPTSKLAGMTPLEAFTGRRPSLGDLRVWGCLAYVHVPKEKRGKLQPRSTACTLVGYSTESKAYLLWDPTRQAVVVSRDVTFVEHRRGPLIPGEAEGPVISANGDNRPVVTASGPTSLQRPLLSTAPGPQLRPPQESPPPQQSPQQSQQQRLPLATAPIGKKAAAAAPASRRVPSTQTPVMTRQRVADVQSQAAAQLSGSGSGPAAVRPSGNLSFSEFIRQQTSGSSDDDVDPQDRIPLSQILSHASQPSSAPASSSQSPSGLRTLHEDSKALSADTVTAAVDGIPSSYREAMSRPDKAQWEGATQEEIDSIHAARTWTLAELPPGFTLIGSKWVLNLKRNADGSIARYKARVVAKGYGQKEGIDYTETFAPVAKFSTIRALLSITAYYDLELHQMDVKTAFLNGDLDHEIYMEQPEGFIAPNQQHLVCKLHKAIYGLKQAGRSWNIKIDDTLRRLGFAALITDSCVYVYSSGRVVVYIALYVDDLLLVSNSLPALTRLKADLAQQFSMKDLGEAQYVLGIQIERNRSARTLSISQAEYVRNVLDRFGMTDCKSVRTPLEISRKLTKEDCPPAGATTDVAFTRQYQSAVGAIMYAMLGTRPDIAFAVTTLSQFNSNPGQVHWAAVKHVMRYLRGSIDYRLTYGPSGKTTVSPIVYGYSDSDWGNNTDDRRSVTGYVFILGGGAVSWQARKQTTVALSSVEAEYMAATQSTKEAMWWRYLLSDLGIDLGGPTLVYSDSQGSIALTKNPEHHARSKHIDIRHHFVREQVAAGTIEVDYVPTGEMVADVLTKVLPRDNHLKLITMMGIRSPSSAVGVLKMADRGESK